MESRALIDGHAINDPDFSDDAMSVSFTDPRTLSEYYGSGATYEDALADGMLIALGPMAAEAGFTHAVTITRHAWNDCVSWSPQDTVNTRHEQEQDGRLWDVLWMALLAQRRLHGRHLSPSTVEFEVFRIRRDACPGPRRGAGIEAEAVALVYTLHTLGAEQAITIMLSHEQ